MSWFLDHIWGITLTVLLFLFVTPILLLAGTFWVMRDADLDDFDTYFEGD